VVGSVHPVSLPRGGRLPRQHVAVRAPSTCVTGWV
jgi:hypothetical protein